jgi:hypothetical protein
MSPREAASNASTAPSKTREQRFTLSARGPLTRYALERPCRSGAARRAKQYSAPVFID